MGWNQFMLLASYSACNKVLCEHFAVCGWTIVPCSNTPVLKEVESRGQAMTFAHADRSWLCSLGISLACSYCCMALSYVLSLSLIIWLAGYKSPRIIWKRSFFFPLAISCEEAATQPRQRARSANHVFGVTTMSLSSSLMHVLSSGMGHLPRALRLVVIHTGGAG